MRAWKWVAVAAVGVAAYAGWRQMDQLGKVSPAGAATAPAAMLMPVPVAKIVKKTLPVYLEYSARAESIGNVTLQAKVGGYLKTQVASDGADVKQGDLLYQIDPRDLQAALDQVNSQADRDLASLDYMRANYNRGTELAKTGFLGKDAYDQRGSSMKQAEAALASDQAAIRAAKLNLDYADIHAPFPGRLGRNQAPIGTLVGAGVTVLNNLVQLDPIYVTFNPSETDLGVIEGARAKGKVAADVFLPGATTPIHTGDITFIDNMVDRATGTIAARATIKNASNPLVPGQYVRIRLRIKDEPNVLMAPQVAIGSSQLGKFLYVVGDGDKVERRSVTLGSADGELVAITDGAKEGDRVIVGNLQKIGPGMPVKPLEGK